MVSRAFSTEWLTREEVRAYPLIEGKDFNTSLSIPTEDMIVTGDVLHESEGSRAALCISETPISTTCGHQQMEHSAAINLVDDSWKCKIV